MIKELFKKNYLVILFFLFGGPLFIGLGVKFIDYVPLLNKLPGNNSDWISFWGAYLGVISTIFMAYLISKYEANLNKEEIEDLQNNQMKIVETIEKISETQIEIGKQIASFSLSREQIAINEIKLQSDFLQMKFYFKYIERLFKEIENTISAFSQFNQSYSAILLKFKRAPSNAKIYKDVRVVYKRYTEITECRQELEITLRMIDSLKDKRLNFFLGEIFFENIKKYKKYADEFTDNFFEISGPFIRANNPKYKDSDNVISKDANQIINNSRIISEEDIAFIMVLLDETEFIIGQTLSKLLTNIDETYGNNKKN